MIGKLRKQERDLYRAKINKWMQAHYSPGTHMELIRPKTTQVVTGLDKQ